MILAPSILAADLGHLAEQVRATERGGAGLLHVDVMDGQFVPNLSLGPSIVEALKRASSLPIDCHLMVRDGDRHIDAFVDAGAASVTVHVEAVTHLQRALAQLRGRGVGAGVALNPATPIGALDEVLPELDQILVMSVNPGFGGQTFLPASLDKIRRLRRLLDERGVRARIQVDGGIHAGNIQDVVRAGADVIIAGSAAFRSGDPEQATRSLIEAAR